MSDFSILAKRAGRNLVQSGTPSLRSRLQIGSALVGASMALISPAMAFGGPECGPAVGGAVTCTGAYGTGVTYFAGGQDDLTLNIDRTATVTTTATADSGVYVSTGQGVLSINQNGVVLTAGDEAHGLSGLAWGGDVFITNTGDVTTNGVGAFGVVATAAGGDRTITNSGRIATTGRDSAGVYVVSQDGEVSVVNEAGGTVSAAGVNGSGILGVSILGDVKLENHGQVTTAGPQANAIGGYVYDGRLSLISTGGVTTNGEGSAGVVLQNFGGDIIAEVGSVTVNGANGIGVSILNTSAGSVVLTTSGAISAAGVGSEGIAAASNGGSVSITNNADITADELGIVSRAATTLDITNSGAITTTAGNGYAIAGHSTADGPVRIVNTGSASTAGMFAIALKGDNQAGVVAIDNQGSVSTIGELAMGIQGKTVSGAVTLTNGVGGLVTTHGGMSSGLRSESETGVGAIGNQGSVSTGGYQAYGLEGQTVSGSLTLTNGVGGVVTTTGVAASGLYAQTDGGDAILGNQGSVSTSGYQAHGLEARTNSGSLTLTNGADGVITTSGLFGSGLKAESKSGLISVDNQGVVTTTGEGGHGIEIATARMDPALAERGDVALVSRGQITTSGVRATGVLVQTVTGDITADIGAVSTGGEDSDAVSLWTTSGDVALVASGVLSTEGANSDAVMVSTITGKIDVNNRATVRTAGDNSMGLYAQAESGSITIVNTGAVSTSGFESDAIRAQAQGDVTISTVAVATTGERSAGVSASSFSGVARVIASGPLTTGGDGVFASTVFGSVDVLALGAISTTGVFGNGVRAASDSGDISINAEGTITTAGSDANAVFVENYTGKTTVLTKGALSTSGDDADGISVYGGGDVSITTAAITTTGYSADAIRARSENGTAKIVALGLISTSDHNSDGVDVNSYTGDVDVTVGAIATRGDNASGVEADSDDGVVRIVSTGAITTEGEESYGIDADGGGGIAIDAHAISTLGVNAHGVMARSGGNASVIRVNSVSAAGLGSYGVDVSSEVGDMTVAAGVVRAADTAIRAMSGEGDIAVSTTGAVTSAAAGAIHASTTEGAVVLDIGAASVLTSGVPAVLPVAFNAGAFGPASVAAPGVSTVFAEGRTVTINNAGVINQGEQAAISARGQTTLNNSGRITGSLDFGGGDDVVHNSGRFILSGVSDFGGGGDLFRNTGEVTVAGLVSLRNLERFVNAGTITMANGRTGDVLSIAGDYVGQAGRLVLDVDAGAAGGPRHDQLVVGGSASGTTTIVLNYSNNALLKPGAVLKLVDAAGGSAPGAFTLAGETDNIGFIRYGLRHDAAADDFFIAVTEGDAVFRAMKLNEGAQALWRQSAEAWSSHIAALRDPSEDGAARRVWGQIHRASDKRQEILARPDQAVSLSYDQDHHGGQMGLDLGRIGDTGVTYGVTGGYVDSEMRFRDTADRADYRGFNLGTYAGLRHGRYFINALAKHDWFDVKSRSVTAGYEETLDGRGYGLQLETGVRLNGEIEARTFFFEPAVSLAYSRTDLDALATQGAVIDFEALDGLRARAGARLGGATAVAQGQVAYYLGAHFVQELAGEGGVRFTSGAADSAFENEVVDAFGQYQLGVTFTSKTGLTGFAEARADSGDDYRNYTGRIGVRVAF